MNCFNNTGFFKPAQMHQRTNSQADQFRGQQQNTEDNSHCTMFRKRKSKLQQDFINRLHQGGKSRQSTNHTQPSLTYEDSLEVLNGAKQLKNPKAAVLGVLAPKTSLFQI